MVLFVCQDSVRHAFTYINSWLNKSMTKNNREINLFDISQIKNRNKRSDKIKTTNINILLNRVTISRKTEFKKKIIFLSLLILSVSIVGIIYLI